MNKRGKIIAGTSACALLVVAAIAWFLLHGKSSYVSSLPEQLQAVAMLDASTLDKQHAIELDEKEKLELENSGIDLTKPLYAFVDNADCPGLLLPLHDAARWTSYLESKGLKTEHQRGMQWAIWGNWLLAYSNDRCMARGPLSEQEMARMRGTMAELMKQGKSTKPALLEQLEGQQGAVKIAVMPDLITHQLISQWPIIASGLKGGQDGTALASLDFNGKSIMLDVELKDMGLCNNASAMQPLAKGCIMPPPYTTLAYFTLGINGESLLPLMRKWPRLRTQLLALNFCIDADMIIRSVDGAVTMSMPDKDDVTDDFMLTAQLKDTRFMQNKDEWNKGLASNMGVSITELSDSAFCLNAMGGTYCFGVHDSRLILCTSPDMLQSALHQTPAADDTTEAADADGCIAYIRINMNAFLKSAAGVFLLSDKASSIAHTLSHYDAVVVRIKASDSAATDGNGDKD